MKSTSTAPDHCGREQRSRVYLVNYCNGEDYHHSEHSLICLARRLHGTTRNGGTSGSMRSDVPRLESRTANARAGANATYHMFLPSADVACAAAIILLIGVFYLTTIRAGQGWGDDFAQYIQEAKDISHGASYTHSNYVFNPQNPGIGPESYPPGYPLLLVPVYLHWGVNFAAMKVENILFFLGFLFFFYLLIHDELSVSYAIVALAIVGLNPVLWLFKDNVDSEMSFIFFLFLCFFVIQRTGVTENRHFSILSCVGVSLLIFFTYEIRIIGILIVPALIACEAWRKKGLPWFSVIVTVLFGCFYATQALLIHGSRGYWETIRVSTLSFSWILQSARGYGAGMSDFWENGYSRLFRAAIFVPGSLLALLGYLQRARTRVTMCEIYIPLHLVVTIIWPFPGGLRFLIPIFPLYVFYSLLGVRDICTRFSVKRPEQTSLAVVVFFVATTYAGNYSKMDFGTIPGGFGNLKCTEFFEYVKEQTDPTSVFIFKKPRALGLFGERRTSGYPAPGSDADLWNYINSVHASYLVESPIDAPFWDQFVDRNRPRLCEVYSNGDFKVYKVPGLSPGSP